MREEESTETTRDWASIPGDLLRSIAERVGSIEDYVRFGAVCHSWHSSTTASRKSMFFPWLMLAEKEDSDMRGFYSMASDKVFELELPEIRGSKCWGSPFGWLITYGLDLQIHVFNPISRARLSLPPQRTFTNQYGESVSTPEYLREVFIKKIQVSKSSDFIVMAIYSQYRKLAIAKPGDEAWRPIQCHLGFDDIIYFDGNLFAVISSGNDWICEDLDAHNPFAVEFAAPPPPRQFGSRNYLVDLGGDLCMVCRTNVPIEIMDDTGEVKESYETDDFVIFKLDMHTRNWETVSSLGDWCLFLGCNFSFSIRASDYSGSCRSNCIYFTDDHFESYFKTLGSDMGIFNYENKEVDYFPELPDMDSLFCPPLWIAPCLQ